MEFTEALKKVQTNKNQDNFILVSMGWDQKYVFPYKEGMECIAAFEHALCFKEDYDNNSRLIPIKRDHLAFHVLSREDYENIQIAGLLNLKLSQIKEMRNPTPPEKEET